MYVNIYIFSYTPIYLRILLYLAKKCWALWINKYENLHDKKGKKIHSEKTASQFSIIPWNKIKKLTHNTIQWLKCVVHYLNMKMKVK